MECGWVGERRGGARRGEGEVTVGGREGGREGEVGW